MTESVKLMQWTEPILLATGQKQENASNTVVKPDAHSAGDHDHRGCQSPTDRGMPCENMDPAQGSKAHCCRAQLYVLP